MKNSVITQKNDGALSMSRVDVNLLGALKEEIIKRVREEFDMKGGKPNQSQALELFIDNKVSETIKTIFPY